MKPIFLKRADGLGWTLNFDRPVSYLVLAIVLGIPFAWPYTEFYIEMIIAAK